MTIEKGSLEATKWIFLVDGLSNLKENGAEVMLEGACGVLIEKCNTPFFPTYK